VLVETSAASVMSQASSHPAVPMSCQVGTLRHVRHSYTNPSLELMAIGHLDALLSVDAGSTGTCNCNMFGMLACLPQGCQSLVA
jgi:hypothetical protein